MPRVAWQTWSGQFGRGAAERTTTGVPTAAAMCIARVVGQKHVAKFDQRTKLLQGGLTREVKGPEVPLRLSICGGEFQDWSHLQRQINISLASEDQPATFRSLLKFRRCCYKAFSRPALGWPNSAPALSPNKGWDLLGLSGARPKRSPCLPGQHQSPAKKAPSGVVRSQSGGQWRNRGFDAPLAKWPWPPSF